MKKIYFKYFVNWIPVLITLTLILFVISTTSIQILEIYSNRKLKFQTITGVVLFFVYHVFNLLLIISFLSLSIFDAGSLEFLKCELEAPDDLKLRRYCDKCSIKRWKPPRAHHCSVCNKCIFKMDHHCFLINNCVGFSNQKNYILFLFYLICSTLVSILSTLFLLIKHVFLNTRELARVSLTHIHINLITSFVILLFSISFFNDQLDYILTNSSLVELIYNKKGKEINLMKKLHSVFGKSFYLWFIPFSNNCDPEFTEELYEVIKYPYTSSFETIKSNTLDLNDCISYLSSSEIVSITKYKTE
ncbi:DHHC family palmitoyl transferase with a signal peptide and 4 transmembrane domain [Cryptosporidium ryanae]|uniref:DHHC family palmitoyl transferase with a signal peptide and 4 transmembrane domain n=1 Tax=Cryptosporidium ryanae TaxID=515981 RepID=UPI00351AA1CB|nr:DHHC family palmitoyl transferase with a signal peptide and 4 transmembrane domain [Cryptosporidium ryanae]